MRNITKLPEPAVLVENGAVWTDNFLGPPRNDNYRYRYRNAEIKETLKSETGWKCIYCESKIGHNTPGDVEHKAPTSIAPNRHYEWNNLSVACTECNRRKNDYFDEDKPFLDPYVDDVEARVVHYGPVMGWAVGDETAEITLRTLELNDETRDQLIKRKIEKIGEINNLCARLIKAAGTELEALLKVELERKTERAAEYSAMVLSVLRTQGAL